MKFIVIVLYLCFANIFTCKNKYVSNDNHKTKKVSINLDNASRINYNDLFEIGSWIVLEQTSNSLLSVPVELIFSQDAIMYLEREKQEKIVKFSPTGSFLSDTKFQEEGPNSRISAFNIAKYADYTFMIDPISNKLFRFNNQLVIDSVFTLKNIYVTEIESDNFGLYLFEGFSNPFNSNYYLTYCDENLNSKTQLIPRNKSYDKLDIISGSFLSHTNDSSILFYHPLNRKITELKHGKIVTEYELDIKEFIKESEIINLKDYTINQTLNLLNDPEYIVEITSSYKFNNNLFLVFKYHGKGYWLFYSLTNKTYKLYNFTIDDPSFPLKYPLAFFNDYFYFSFAPTVRPLQYFKQKGYHFKQDFPPEYLLNQQNENPKLFRVKIKYPLQ